MKNLNRKFRRVLSIASLGALHCQSVIAIGPRRTEDENMRYMYEMMSTQSNGHTRDDSTWTDDTQNFTWRRIDKKTVRGVTFLAVHVEPEEDEAETDKIIFIDDKTQSSLYLIPYHETIMKLLPKHYRNLGENYEFSKYSDKWDVTNSEFNYCLRNLENLERSTTKKDETDSKPDKNKMTGRIWIDDVADFLGWTRGQVVLSLLVGSIVVVGTGVYILNKTILNVGKAVGTAIHGEKQAPEIVGYTRVPIVYKETHPDVRS